MTSPWKFRDLFTVQASTGWCCVCREWKAAVLALCFHCSLLLFVLLQCSVPCSHWADEIGQIPQFSKRKRIIRTDEGWDLPLSGTWANFCIISFGDGFLIFHLSNTSPKHRLQEMSWHLWNEGLISHRAQIGQRVPLQGLASCHPPGSNL